MPLAPGGTLGPYTVIAKIGEGGMGEVYRARDTQLDRDVALKVLSSAFTADSDRLARFEREAKVLASLNHTHIGHIYGLEQADGQRALVLEYVDGPTLADLIASGAGNRESGVGLPLNDALAIASQIAEALEAAHEQGIIHRDLKPANIKVRPDGTVKVLDFGLAKALQDPRPQDPRPQDPRPQDPRPQDPKTSRLQDLANSPTVASPAMTAAGIILGTAAYMSPEQARGQVVDARTDLWAFGCVLFEMLTGRRPFAGDTVTDLLAAVVKEEPPWDALPADTPAATRKLLRRCLTKDRKRRLASAADARLDVEESLEPGRSDPAPDTGPASRRSPLTVALALGVALAGVAAGYVLARGTAGVPLPSAPGTRFIIPAPPGTQIVTGHREIAISADGQQVAFIARGATDQHIYVRRVDDLTPRQIAGTEGARDLTFSPDGRSLAFHSGDTVRKVSLAGGAPTVLADAPHTHGLAWRPGEDAIYFAPSSATAIWKVPASGESPAVPVTTLDAAGGETSHNWPVFSADGDTLIFTVEGTELRDPVVSVLPLATGARRTMRTAGGAFALTSAREILFVRGQSAMRTLDSDERLSSPEPIETATPIADANQTGQVALSATGTLAYVPSADLQRRSLVWVSPDGRLSDAGFGQRAFRGVALSPDGRRVALQIFDDPDEVLYRAEAAGGPLTPLTKGTDGGISWSPDGRWLADTIQRGGSGSTYLVSRVGAEAGGGWDTVYSFQSATRPGAQWTADGAMLVSGGLQAGRGQVLLLKFDGTTRAEASVVVDRAGGLEFASLSPDGRWLAYESTEFGRPEVYVESYPSPTVRVPVSQGLLAAANASRPTWSRAGDALYFLASPAIVRVPLTTAPDLRVGTPQVVVSDALIVRAGENRGAKWFDVAPDGRILAIRNDDSVRSDHIVVEQNWLSGVQGRTSGGRE